MQSRWHGVAMLVAILALAAGAVLWRSRGRLHNLGQPAPAGPAAGSKPEHLPRQETPAGGARRELQAAAAALRGATDGDASRRSFAELRSFLSSLTGIEASAAIRAFLESGNDATSQLGFTVGSEGFLVASPSLRVFLLDLLGQIDPAAASAYARVILTRMDSADEWAVCLRNVARAGSDPGTRSYLPDRLDEMLRHEPWQRNPSVGFLEAFDVAVYLGGTNFIPGLSQLARKQDNPAVAHAAFLALDRLVQNDTGAALQFLLDQPDLLAGREATRAGYFARADVRDPAQRELLARYLLSPTRSMQELTTFAGLFPNANFMVSHNLLTQTATLANAELRSRDAAALGAINAWLGEEKFRGLDTLLRQMQRRLGEFYRDSSPVSPRP